MLVDITLSVEMGLAFFTHRIWLIGLILFAMLAQPDIQYTNEVIQRIVLVDNAVKIGFAIFTYNFEAGRNLMICA